MQSLITDTDRFLFRNGKWIRLAYWVSLACLVALMLSSTTILVVGESMVPTVTYPIAQFATILMALVHLLADYARTMPGYERGAGELSAEAKYTIVRVVCLIAIALIAFAGFRMLSFVVPVLQLIVLGVALYAPKLNGYSTPRRVLK